MITGSRAVWEVCGSPRVEGCAAIPLAPCWVCGAETMRAMPREAWMGASYTGQNRVRCPESIWVCEPCLHVMSRIAPVPGRPPGEGKKFGGNFRNFSHLWEAAPGGAPAFYANASKAEKPTILAFLRRIHLGAWFAAIADSGQKHILPWVPVNPAHAARGVVLFDEQVVKLPAGVPGWKLVDDMAALLTVGATKDELSSGSYSPRTWRNHQSPVRNFETTWGEPKRGGAWFGLALWLAQRDEEKANATTGRRRKDATRESHGDAVARASARVPGHARVQPAQALGPIAEPNESRSEDDGQRPRMARRDVPKPPAWGPAQLDLFGRDGAPSRHA